MKSSRAPGNGGAGLGPARTGPGTGEAGPGAGDARPHAGDTDPDAAGTTDDTDPSGSVTAGGTSPSVPVTTTDDTDPGGPVTTAETSPSGSVTTDPGGPVTTAETSPSGSVTTDGAADPGGPVTTADGPGAGPAEPAPPGGAPVRPRVDPVAVAAMTLGIIALVPFALVAGVISLARTRNGRRGGRAMAVAGIVLAGVWTLTSATVATVILTHPRHQAPRPRPLAGLAGTVFSLQTGQCADTAPNDISSARVVPCRRPHDTQIFATFRAPGRRWPGQQAVRAEASNGCMSRLGTFLNPRFATGLTESYAYPNRGAWLAGERTVVCEIHSASGKLTGTVRRLGK